ncbi:hypothetical protein [Erwinia sp. V71]|uniref:hypothetical protein n=1 Tax=Erwinia sp. V71 TaxID=3369424 RepID=UPI003F61FA6F
MMAFTLRLWAGIAMLVWSQPAIALTSTFTATFSPSMDNPNNNSFKNTTPISGYCATSPSQCVAREFR